MLTLEKLLRFILLLKLWSTVPMSMDGHAQDTSFPLLTSAYLGIVCIIQKVCAMSGSVEDLSECDWQQFGKGGRLAIAMGVRPIKPFRASY